MLLAWGMNNLFKSLLNLFNSKGKNNLMTIEELRDLKLRKEKIEKAKKSRVFISEINQRYNKISDRKRKNFFRKAS